MLQSLLLEELPTGALNHTLSGLPGFPLASGWDPSRHPSSLCTPEKSALCEWLQGLFEWQMGCLDSSSTTEAPHIEIDDWMQETTSVLSFLVDPVQTKSSGAFFSKQAKSSKWMKTFVCLSLYGWESGQVLKCLGTQKNGPLSSTYNILELF